MCFICGIGNGHLCWLFLVGADIVIELPLVIAFPFVCISHRVTAANQWLYLLNQLEKSNHLD